MKIIAFVLLMLLMLVGSLGIQTVSSAENTAIHIYDSSSNYSHDFYTNENTSKLKISAKLFYSGGYTSLTPLDFDVYDSNREVLWHDTRMISFLGNLASTTIPNSVLKTWPTGDYRLIVNYRGNDELRRASALVKIHHTNNNMTIVS